MEVDNTTMLLGPQGIRPLHLHAPVLPRKGDMMACAVSNSAWRKVQQASQVVVPQTTPTYSVVTSVIRVVMTPCRPSMVVALTDVAHVAMMVAAMTMVLASPRVAVVVMGDAEDEVVIIRRIRKSPTQLHHKM